MVGVEQPVTFKSECHRKGNESVQFQIPDESLEIRISELDQCLDVLVQREGKTEGG